VNQAWRRLWRRSGAGMQGKAADRFDGGLDQHNGHACRATRTKSPGTRAKRLATYSAAMDPGLACGENEIVRPLSSLNDSHNQTRIPASWGTGNRSERSSASSHPYGPGVCA
jgi:hypothetical protein